MKYLPCIWKHTEGPHVSLPSGCWTQSKWKGADVNNAVTQPDSRLLPRSKPHLDENLSQKQQVRGQRREANIITQPTNFASRGSRGPRLDVHHYISPLSIPASGRETQGQYPAWSCNFISYFWAVLRAKSVQAEKEAMAREKRLRL